MKAARIQLDVFDGAAVAVLREAPYQASSRTSREAAALVRPRARPQRERVLEHLRTAGPSTRHEIAEALGIPLSSVCGRLDELKTLGLVVGTGVDRETPNGGNAEIMRLR